MLVFDNFFIVPSGRFKNIFAIIVESPKSVTILLLVFIK